MSFKDGPFQDLKVPLTWTAAAAAIIAGIIALALLVTDKREAMSPEGYGAFRSKFDQVVRPASGVLAAPVQWTGGAVNYVRGYFFAIGENRRLRAKVSELERWRDAAIALKNANERYEALLKLRTEPPIPMVAGRVVTDARGPFSHARLVDAGTSKGVKIGNPVMNEKGVVGRVVGVSTDVSRVLLLTDVESRTPVLINRTDSRAILTGDGGPNPRLDYVRGQNPVKQGDLILTSGDGGIYPRGLPVGVAVKDIRGVWRVSLYADEASIDFVRILQFEDFGKLADRDALARTAPPPLDPTSAAQLQATLAARLAPPPVKPPPSAPPNATAPASTATPSPATSGSVPAAPARPTPTAPNTTAPAGARSTPPTSTAPATSAPRARAAATAPRATAPATPRPAPAPAAAQ